MNIKQVEQTTGLTARQIREYEKIGLIPAILAHRQVIGTIHRIVLSVYNLLNERET